MIPYLVEPLLPISRFSAADAGRAKLIPGKRVRVNRWSPTLRGLHGVIITPRDDERVGDGDCAVLLDDWDHSLAFYWDEIELVG